LVWLGGTLETSRGGKYCLPHNVNKKNLKGSVELTMNDVSAESYFELLAL
jgi:hypothetical protein